MVAPRNTIYAEESAEVEVLYANLDKLKLLTKKIQGSVQRLDHSGQVIQHAIGPIYSNTQSLQTTTDNIDRMQEAILRLREPLNVQGEEESAIRAGPQAIGIQEYLTAMRRLERALSDLTATNLRANQKAAAAFGFLLATGSSKLQDVFRSILLENINPIEPLHYITKQKQFPVIPSEKITDLTSICEAIISASRYKVETSGKSDINPAVRIYAEIRGAYITNSLSNLATASINTAKRRPEDGPYKQGTNGIGVYASGLEGMIFSEDMNISHIFPVSQRGKALEATCSGVIDDLQKTLRELNVYIKGNLMTDCFLAFEILDIISSLAHQVSGRTGQLKSQLLDVLRPIRDTCKVSLSEILEQTRQRSSAVTMLPTDGAPVPLVSEIMTTIVALAAHSKPLSGILGSIGDGNWKSTSNAPAQQQQQQQQQQQAQQNTDNDALLSQFILDMLEAMLSTLDSRGRSIHRSKLVLGAFLANTICLVDRAIKTNTDLGRYAGSGT
ncbi:exocyst complex component exo70, partial [Ascosphaera aggregata]